MANRRRREYLQLLDSGKAAIELAVDCFNRVHNPYRTESTLILAANAWELLAKAVLVQKHLSIRRGRRGETIGAEIAVLRLKEKGLLDTNQTDTIQQVISLRHAAVHHVLPTVPDEIMHHLLFYGCKFFREVVENVFPSHVKDLPASFLSLSFEDSTTYADKVQRSISRVRRSRSDRRLVWLLERGIAFDGSSYLTEKEVGAKYRGKKQISPHLRLSDFIKRADMVRVVPIEAPKNFTADIILRKGSARDNTLPVVVKRTDLEQDYPYLTSELAAEISRGTNWTSKAAEVLRLKGDTKYHQQVRTSKSGHVPRYSESALQALRAHITTDPTFNPYRSS
ncbi:MAG TPA: DUF3644 domain-containing protein [Acidimicrobiia bacterium]|nr:DUF3644 domain-containing protein [Acidimicrobiia bacterium]